jgi:hypothetical protein
MTVDGVRAALVGDTDGDGYDEFATQPGDNVYETEVRHVFVYRGGPRAAVPAPLDLVDRSFNPAQLAGTDLNGDGFSDLVVAGTGLPSRVRAYLGGPTGLDRDRYVEPAPLPRGCIGAEAFLAIATGDVNGDGFGDVAVAGSACTLPPEPGGIALWLGGLAGFADRRPLVVTATDLEAELGAPFGEAGFGNTVVIPGDVNGDGFDDVAAGAPYWNTGAGRCEQGAVLVWYGHAAGITLRPDLAIENRWDIGLYGLFVAD